MAVLHGSIQAGGCPVYLDLSSVSIFRTPFVHVHIFGAAMAQNASSSLHLSAFCSNLQHCLPVVTWALAVPKGYNSEAENNTLDPRSQSYIQCRGRTGTIIGAINGDARSLDYSSYRKTFYVMRSSTFTFSNV